MRRVKSGRLFEVLIFLLVSFVVLEVASFLLTKRGLFLVNEIPTLYRSTDKAIGLDDWRTEKEEWGAWHTPNARAIHTSPCFSAVYESNEIGARDRWFALESAKSRYVLIGDSMAEGYGVNYSERAQAHIENATTKQLLNFGTAGAFGPVQYWLLYEKLARKYRHDGLIIFFYPANDFTDNDYDVWLRTRQTFFDGTKERYRPYYIAVGDGTYGIFYPKNAEPGAKRPRLKQFLIDYLWFANALRTLRIILVRRDVEHEEIERHGSAGPQQYSGYFDATIEQQRAAVYFVDKLLRRSQAKDIILVAIPAPEDFARVGAGQKREQTFWWREFKSARERLGKPVTFIDLVDFKPTDIDSLFYSCDGHWTPYGNKWAADPIARALRRD